MKRWGAVAVMAVMAVALLAALTWGMDTPAMAAPSAAPTPVSVNHAGVQSKVGEFWTTQVITTDGGSAPQNILGHEKIDLQLVLDMGTTNTTTFNLQFSNDGANWVDGATVGSALAIDTNSLQQYAIFGRYARVYADVENTNPLTVTVIGVAR